eukprot:gene12826-7177_t
MFRKVFLKNTILKHNTGLNFIKKYTTLTVKLSKRFQIFSTFSFFSTALFLWFKHDFKGEELYNTNISNEEYGFETYSDDSWVHLSVTQGESQQIIFTKKSSSTSDNKSFLVCTHVNKEYTFKKYVEVAVESLIKTYQSHPTMKIKSLDQNSKTNSNGIQFEECDFVIYDTVKDENQRIQVSIFYQDKVGYLFETQNELSKFKEDFLKDFVNNFRFTFKILPNDTKIFKGNVKENFTFEYPKNWQIYESYGKDGLHVVQFVKNNRQLPIGGLISHELNLSFEEYTDELINAYQKMNEPDYRSENITSELKVNNNGYKYMEISVDVVVEKGRRKKLRDYVFVEDSTALIVKNYERRFEIEEIVKNLKFQ